MKKLSSVTIHGDGVKQDEIVENRKSITRMILDKKKGDNIFSQTAEIMSLYEQTTGSHIDYSEDLDQEEDEFS